MGDLHVEPHVVFLASESIVAYLLVRNLLQLQTLHHFKEDQLRVLAGCAVNIERSSAYFHSVIFLLTEGTVIIALDCVASASIGI